MRTYIVDDERLAVERLTRLLNATGRVTIFGSQTDPETALAVLRDTPVDVLFLDIQMPGLTGFELLERLDRALDKVEHFAGKAQPDVRALARALAAQLAPGRRLERIASRVGERTT